MMEQLSAINANATSTNERMRRVEDRSAPTLGESGGAFAPDLDQGTPTPARLLPGGGAAAAPTAEEQLRLLAAVAGPPPRRRDLQHPPGLSAGTGRPSALAAHLLAVSPGGPPPSPSPSRGGGAVGLSERAPCASEASGAPATSGAPRHGGRPAGALGSAADACPGRGECSGAACLRAPPASAAGPSAFPAAEARAAARAFADHCGIDVPSVFREMLESSALGLRGWLARASPFLTAPLEEGLPAPDSGASKRAAW